MMIKMEEEIEQIPRAGRIARRQAFKSVRERLLQYWLGEEFFAHAPNVLIAEMVPDKKDEPQSSSCCNWLREDGKSRTQCNGA